MNDLPYLVVIEPFQGGYACRVGAAHTHCSTAWGARSWVRRQIRKQRAIDKFIDALGRDSEVSS